ncbi:MAG: T9SS type A sorting domain-containing protein, partial [Candidatus Cloacimonetes bacterium]|nr:T9SS type A sorting domain-containing protein [Candidatus Cloacimonadota bacterium]
VGLDWSVEDPNVHLTWMDPFTVTGWSEDFEGGVLPDGWTMTTNSAVGWIVTEDYSSGFVTIPPHTWYACANDDAANDDGSMDYLITPPVDLSNASEMQISFASFHNGDYGQLSFLEVSTDGGTTWNVVEEMDPNPDWVTVNVNLDACTGAGFENTMFAFHTDDAGGWAGAWAVDDVVLGDGEQTMMQLTRKQMVSRAEAISTRMLLGYRVEREDDDSGEVTVLTEQITDLEYFDVAPGGTWIYHVYALYTTGLSIAMSTDPITITDNNGNEVPPCVTALNGNYPNPFNPVTTVAFSLAEAGDVTIDIYNVRGQKVTTLVDGPMEAGQHNITWQGTDSNGQPVGSGIFFYKMKSGRFTATKKMILLK